MKRYRIPEIAEKYTNYDMIQAHTELPPLSDPRLRLLFAFLNQKQSLTKQSELYTLVISLVQLGMDTHDLVDTNTEYRTEREMRSRQLKVLAGDYFSTRFYQLLAKAGQIDMISKISNAVCEVNKLKLILYMRMRQLKISADEYFSFAVQLRSELFQHFAEMLEDSLSCLWPDLLDGVSRCEVVLDEMARSDNPKRFDKSWAYWHVLQVGTDEERHQLIHHAEEQGLIKSLVEKYNVHTLLANKLKQSVDTVKAAASKLESDNLINELVLIVDNMVNQQSGTMPVLK